METNFIALRDKAEDIVEQVINVIRKETTKNPLVLFKEENVYDLLDTTEFYDFPNGYILDKYDHHLEGRVMEVKGNKVTLYIHSEDDFTVDVYLALLPFESLLNLLTYLNK